jgi:soluble lytic murein transglycosylase
MLKQRKTKIVLMAGAGLTSLVLGALVSASKLSEFVPDWLGWMSPSSQADNELQMEQVQPSAVSPLVAQSPQQRAAALQLLVQGKKSPDQSQARYLLAADLIQQGNGAAALPLLKDLEQDYPRLAAYVLMQRARAYAASGTNSPAITGQTTEPTKAAWLELLQQFPNESIRLRQNRSPILATGDRPIPGSAALDRNCQNAAARKPQPAAALAPGGALWPHHCRAQTLA